ncbi:hypothetical protein [Aeromonas caviae]|uniref:hypothetical protein n=1 Tax=Aeromonas caviae TaxID=648 RepID=UPI0025B6E95F|nr:hypothetical protein [Aeromonas caviae]
MTHTQAWCWHAPGEPDQLTLTRQALPTPGPDEVLIANRIIAFNPVDWKPFPLYTSDASKQSIGLSLGGVRTLCKKNEIREHHAT